MKCNTRWKQLHPKFVPSMLGYIPSFLNERDPRSASEQINANYIGNWCPFKGFSMNEDWSLSYPGDPPTLPLCSRMFNGEEIIFYVHSWVAIIQPDGSFEVARID